VALEVAGSEWEVESVAVEVLLAVEKEFAAVAESVAVEVLAVLDFEIGLIAVAFVAVEVLELSGWVLAAAESVEVVNLAAVQAQGCFAERYYLAEGES